MSFLLLSNISVLLMGILFLPQQMLALKKDVSVKNIKSILRDPLKVMIIQKVGKSDGF